MDLETINFHFLSIIHAFALDNVQSSPDANLDALVGALVTSDKNIVINVGFWGGKQFVAGSR